MKPCPHCSMMATENQRLRAQVEALKSDIDAEKSRTHAAGERYRRANGAYEAATRMNAEWKGAKG